MVNQGNDYVSMKVLLKKTNIDRMLCLLINKYKKQQSEIMRRPDR